MKNELPNPDVLVWHCRDFIMRSSLMRKALDTSWPQFHVAVHDLVEEIDRLAHSCHLAEFTDHALPHICSLIDRIALWTCSDGKSITGKLSPDQAAVLLVATLLHDLGMISQHEGDLPDDASPEDTLSFTGDLPTWVRLTHVKRLPKLAQRVANSLNHSQFTKNQLFDDSICVAEAHQTWPWDWKGSLKGNPYYCSLASILAISDLLDEDCARCDTKTLLHHRRGTELNVAHWIRHGLSQGRNLIKKGRITVHMVSPPQTTSYFEPVFAALRNHYRLIKLYKNELSTIGGTIINISFTPQSGNPQEESLQLADWDQLEGFETEKAFAFQLLRTFMPEATKDDLILDKGEISRLKAIKMEDVDLTLLRSADGDSGPRSFDERTFHALGGGK